MSFQSLGNGCKLTKGGFGIAAVDEFGVLSNQTKVVVVAKLVITKEIVNLVSHSVTKPNYWGRYKDEWAMEQQG